MAISVNHATKVITVPRADLTVLDSPDDSFYELDTNLFRLELKAYEANEVGMVLDDTHRHGTQVTVAGTTYARTIEMINSFSVEFEDGQYSVRLVGSNNNIFDVQNFILVRNQVQVIPTNSAGLIVVSIGSGLSAAQDTKLTNINALLSTIEGSLDHAEAMRLLLAVLAGKVSGAGSGTERFRDQADSKDRVVSTVDVDGNRTAVSVDPS